VSRKSADGFIEFVTSPNNPDAHLYEPVLGGSAAAIVDHAYYWPHFTHIPAPADEDVMMFTMSKLSGHAGSRFGYERTHSTCVRTPGWQSSGPTPGITSCCAAQVGADQGLERRQEGKRVRSTQHHGRIAGHPAADAADRKVMLATLRGEEDIFAFGHCVMRTRWRRLNAVVSQSRRISLHKMAPAYCTDFKRVTDVTKLGNFRYILITEIINTFMTIISDPVKTKHVHVFKLNLK
jgi:hypothetical protein